MSLLRRLERLEALVQTRSQAEDSSVCRELIYNPRGWKIDKEEAIARMQADELDRLVAAGEIREITPERVIFILTTIVYPPEYPDDPRCERGVANFHRPELRSQQFE
jgi:phenolic acid decarboxylase